MKTTFAETPQQWRRWLAEHHDCESEVWLIFYKSHTGRKSIAYEDAVNEALCYGWIDSLIKRLDDRRYARKFTPRKADSKWSPSNRKRYAELKAAGRLMPSGLERAPPDGRSDDVRQHPLDVPAYMQKALQKHARAWSFFMSLAPSYQQKYIGWIDSAKREETKLRRLKEAIKMLAAGEKPGLK